MCWYRHVWSNTYLQATNTTVEMDCALRDHVTRNNKYINHSNRSLKCIVTFGEQYPNTAPLQLSGRTLVGRVYSGTDPAECISAPGDFLPLRLLLPSGRLGYSPGTWGAPNKGNADGAVSILGKCKARVGYGPAPGPTKKGLVPHLPVRWGAQQIP